MTNCLPFELLIRTANLNSRFWKPKCGTSKFQIEFGLLRSRDFGKVWASNRFVRHSNRMPIKSEFRFEESGLRRELRRWVPRPKDSLVKNSKKINEVNAYKFSDYPTKSLWILIPSDKQAVKLTVLTAVDHRQLSWANQNVPPNGLTGCSLNRMLLTGCSLIGITNRRLKTQTLLIICNWNNAQLSASISNDPLASLFRVQLWFFEILRFFSTRQELIQKCYLGLLSDHLTEIAPNS